MEPNIKVNYEGNLYCGLVPIIIKDNKKTVPLFMHNSAGGKGDKGEATTVPIFILDNNWLSDTVHPTELTAQNTYKVHFSHLYMPGITEIIPYVGSLAIGKVSIVITEGSSQRQEIMLQFFVISKVEKDSNDENIYTLSKRSDMALSVLVDNTLKGEVLWLESAYNNLESVVREYAKSVEALTQKVNSHISSNKIGSGTTLPTEVSSTSPTYFFKY